jgi:hypothetical protein
MSRLCRTPLPVVFVACCKFKVLRVALCRIGCDMKKAPEGA